MQYQPTPQQARWLRRWRETRQPLHGEASVKNQAEFAAMQAANVARFTEWAANLAAALSLNQGGDIKPGGKERQKRRPRQEQLNIPAPDIQTGDSADVILPGDDMELYTREHGQDADG